MLTALSDEAVKKLGGKEKAQYPVFTANQLADFDGYLFGAFACTCPYLLPPYLPAH